MIEYKTYWVELHTDKSGIELHTDKNFDLKQEDIFINNKDMVIIHHINIRGKTSHTMALTNLRLEDISFYEIKGE